MICEALSDRMPAVARGEASWDADEAAHFDICDDCQAEWALVADLFERDGLRGAPPRYDRRAVVNACVYLVRTGCAWRLLPKSFPP